MWFGNNLSFMYQLWYTSSSHKYNFKKLIIYGDDLWDLDIEIPENVNSLYLAGPLLV